ncbi:hypothetical protein LEP1GSC073_0763 [Leptospira noguchii str. Cascata]|uniref:C2H2-type domain-containing protein n=1 Tax=Leptospira noguchii str. 2007001578 TaxID=1049974 RepID=A0ABN0IVS4_9LEPT|nr:hypothetical protein LEP1GSC035_1297 [Leptospira noguchii str. 2007001578]EMO27829.1 hypothetical protein LEP1GSC170_4793 [Leptospira interrogans serovar Bataviae str. HAI135]EMS89427.1 hypothetical protein LEP1GSC073_0763 [Leptospira noguchii str. Cascata]
MIHFFEKSWDLNLIDSFLKCGNYCKLRFYKRFSKLGTHTKLNHKKRMFKKYEFLLL